MKTKNLIAATLSTTSTTLATTTSKTIIKEILLCNKTATATTVTINFDGKSVIAGKSLEPNDTLIISLSTVLDANKAITGLAQVNDAIDIIISGVEEA